MQSLNSIVRPRHHGSHITSHLSRIRRMPTTIYWYLKYTPGDYNAVGEYQKICVQSLLQSLNSAGAADGNTFPEGTPTDYAVYITVSEFSDHNSANERHSLNAQVWALGHRDMAFSVSTASYAVSDNDAMIDDLGNKIYYWFHTGWHTN